MKKGFWSAGRLVIGIILIILSIFVLFQSCAAGFINTLESNTSDFGGTVGFIVSIFMIASGIVSICTRNSIGKVGPIFVAVLLLIAALLAFCNATVFQDLIVWGIACAAFGIMFIICAIKSGGKS